MRTLVLTLTASTACVLFALRARAQDVPPLPEPPPEEPAMFGGHSYTKQTWPRSFVERPPTLAPGMVEIFAPISIALSEDRVGEPVNIAPNIGFGVTDQLTVRLLHDEPFRPPGAATGICIGGTDSGCPNAYNNVGLDALYLFVNARNLSIAAIAGLDAFNIDPFQFGGELGFILQLEGSIVQLELAPAFYIAFDDRDAGNEDFFGTRAELLVQVHKIVGLAAITGIYGRVDEFGDRFVIPVGVGASFSVTKDYDLGARFTFTNLLGRDASAEQRQATVFAAIRL